MFIGPRVKFRGDGTPVVGIRKFTPKELAEYCRNMYGQRYYSRHSYLVNKDLGPERRHEIALKRWETIRDKQTPDEISEMMRRRWDVIKARPDYAELMAKRRRPHSDATKAKMRQAWQRRRANDEIVSEKHSKANRYFICDCEIDGVEFIEGECINRDDPAWDKAKQMGLVCFYHQLTPETQIVAKRKRHNELNAKYRVMRWFRQRPDVLYDILFVAKA